MMRLMGWEIRMHASGFTVLKSLTRMFQCSCHSHADDRSATSTMLVSRNHSKLRHAQLSSGQEFISYMLLITVS
jgi:hypothetical protein